MIRDVSTVLQILAMVSVILSHREIWNRISHTYASISARRRSSDAEPWTYADTVDAFLLRRVADDERAARSQYLKDRSQVDLDRVLATCEVRRDVVEIYRRSVDSSSTHAGAYLKVIRLAATLYSQHPDFKAEWRLPRKSFGEPARPGPSRAGALRRPEPGVLAAPLSGSRTGGP